MKDAKRRKARNPAGGSGQTLSLNLMAFEDAVRGPISAHPDVPSRLSGLNKILDGDPV